MDEKRSLAEKSVDEQSFVSESGGVVLRRVRKTSDVGFLPPDDDRIVVIHNECTKELIINATVQTRSQVKEFLDDIFPFCFNTMPGLPYHFMSHHSHPMTWEDTVVLFHQLVRELKQ